MYLFYQLLLLPKGLFSVLVFYFGFGFGFVSMLVNFTFFFTRSPRELNKKNVC